MEGKELRFGIGGSVLTAVVTSNTATGSNNSMHDSFSSLGGMVLLVNMQLGELVFGGLGSGIALVALELAIFQCLRKHPAWACARDSKAWALGLPLVLLSLVSTAALSAGLFACLSVLVLLMRPSSFGLTAKCPQSRFHWYVCCTANAHREMRTPL